MSLSHARIPFFVYSLISSIIILATRYFEVGVGRASEGHGGYTEIQSSVQLLLQELIYIIVILSCYVSVLQADTV